VVDRDRKSKWFLLLPRLKVSFGLLLFLVAAFSAAFAQGPVEDDLAPPPLRVLSHDEKLKLGAESDVKRRTKIALEFMELRLKQAEAFNAEKNYDQMYVQLGAFHGLMDNMLEFLNKSDKDNNKVLNNFKKFEIGLRGFTSRLEMIRHDLPIRYDHYVKRLVKYIRDARASAIEPLFDDTVVPEKKPANRE